MYLLKDPTLYSLGLNKEGYNNKIFLGWVFYGMFQSLLIYIVTI